MKVKITVLIICVSLCLLYLAGGCEEEKISKQKTAQPIQTPEKPVAAPEGWGTSIPKAEIEKEAGIKPADANTTKGPVKGPRITFEKTTIDLGNISINTSTTCEFKFKSSGTEPIEITNVRTTCGCTTAKLDKKPYPPGESNSIKITYHSGPMNEKANKSIYVLTNDVVSPTIQLNITATVQKKVEARPDILTLSLKQPNAGCPEITLHSLDNLPFTITQIKSTADCISINFDPSKQLVTHTLKPVVDIKKLEQILTGEIQFTLTHPQCNSVTVGFKTPAEFSTSPATILILNAEPNIPTIRDQVWVINNYGESFEIQSVNSLKGYVKNLSTQKAEAGRSALKLEITPPRRENNVNAFVDTVVIKTRNGKEIKIVCRGYYKRQPGRT
jgi:hypothetical protein